MAKWISRDSSRCQEFVSFRFFPRIEKYLSKYQEERIKFDGEEMQVGRTGIRWHCAGWKHWKADSTTVRPFSSRLSFRAISLPTMNLSAAAHTFGSRPFLLLLLVIPLSSSASLALVKTAAAGAMVNDLGARNCFAVNIPSVNHAVDSV